MATATGSEAVVAAIRTTPSDRKSKPKKSYPNSTSAVTPSTPLSKGNCFSCAAVQAFTQGLQIPERAMQASRAERACQSNRRAPENANLQHVQPQQTSADSMVVTVNFTLSKLWKKAFQVGNVSLTFTIDTGSEVTIIPENLVINAGLELSSEDVNVKAYGGNKILFWVA